MNNENLSIGVLIFAAIVITYYIIIYLIYLISISMGPNQPKEDDQRTIIVDGYKKIHQTYIYYDVGFGEFYRWVEQKE